MRTNKNEIFTFRVLLAIVLSWHRTYEHFYSLSRQRRYILSSPELSHPSVSLGDCEVVQQIWA
jgi:hypothetical protein